MEVCYECADNNQSPRTTDMGLGVGVRRCPKEEFENLCEGNNEGSMSIHFPGKE